MRLIDAEALKPNIDKFIGYLDEDMIARMEMCTKDIPSAEPKTGHWYIDERPESDREVICSDCEQPIFKYHKMD